MKFNMLAALIEALNSNPPKNKKLQILDAVIDNLDLTSNDVINWLNNKGQSVLVNTPLPLLYRHQDEGLVIVNGFDDSKRANLWGIYVNGICVSLNPIFDASRETFNIANQIASRNTKDGIIGRLPSVECFKQCWSKELLHDYNKTLVVLEDNGVSVKSIKELFWCNNRISDDETQAIVFDWQEGTKHVLSKKALVCVRPAIFFGK